MTELSTTISVTLDDELLRGAEQCAAECGLVDVQGLIVYLLRSALRLEDKTIDEQELALVEDRLRDLGYLE